MKLLGKEDLKGIDSTSKTIAKWDAFLKKAVYNLGYDKNVIEHMYPYQKGIPMLDGTYMPVNELTGRVFYKLSWSEKLCGMLSTLISRNGIKSISKIKKMMYHLWREESVFKEFFSDIEINENFNYEAEFGSYWRRFIDNCDIYLSCLSNDNYTNNFSEGKLTTEEKIQLGSGNLTSRMSNRLCDGSVMFIFYKPFEEIYDKKFLDKNLFISIAGDNGWSFELDKMVAFSEVYLQDYLVISLNPIDKLMCSTKQAFSSCMSIAKQDSVAGTSSNPAFGLPALFPFDSVFLTFVTAGKHKNMYWEQEEWEKDATDRDPEKAYKYLKMTCRALTYKGTIRNTNFLAEKRYEVDDEQFKGIVETLEADKERLFVGRQYSARGEDFTWQTMVEHFMTRAGISTGMASADKVEKLRQEYPNTRWDNYKLLRIGTMAPEETPIVWDRFGYIRGIYYDNLSLSFERRAEDIRVGRNSGQPREASDSTKICCSRTRIKVGCSRSGTGSAHGCFSRPGLDMFKMMMGKQKYNYFNQYVKVCSECGELITSKDVAGMLPDGGMLCTKCYSEHGYKLCPSCGELFKEEESSKHELFNLNEIIYPKTYNNYPPFHICKKKLEQITAYSEDAAIRGASKAICLHCGKIHAVYSSDMVAIKKWKGMNLFVTICSKCLRKATMCEKCKKVVFLESMEQPMLLLPNRRVICPDCIDDIRLKSELRKNIKEAISALPSENWSEDIASDNDILNKLAAKFFKEGNEPRTITKDIQKQIRSFLMAHPEKEFVEIKEALPDRIEVEDITPVSVEDITSVSIGVPY